MPLDLQLALLVSEKLASSRRGLSNVAVLVVDGHVRLRGPAPTFYLRQVAVDRARGVPGVQHVADEMRVEEA